MAIGIQLPIVMDYYMGTDAGYMRHILFYGIWPSLLIYGFTLYWFIFAAKRVGSIDKYGKILLYMTCAYYFFSSSLKRGIHSRIRV